MLILFFLIPLLFYVIFYSIFRASSKYNFIFAVSVATVSLLTATVTIHKAPQWASNERIIWTGIRVKSANLIQRLEIGGAIETASVGWANGAFAPRVEAALDGDYTNLTISEGGGFIKNEKGDFLNGEEIEPNNSKNFGPFTFLRTSTSWLFRSRDRLLISFGENKLVDLKLPTDSPKVYNLTRLIELQTVNAVSSIYQSPSPEEIEKIKNLESLKSWAQNVRILAGNKIAPRILTMESRNAENKPIPCKNPCKFTVLWAGNSQISAQFVREGKGNLALQYLPPFRNMSPLPPSEANNQLTIAGQAHIGDFAFTLPLAGEEQKTMDLSRPKIDILPIQKTDQEDPAIIEKRKSDCSFLPPEFQKILTCKSVEGKNLGYVMATVNDLPDFYKILGLFLIALGIFIYGAYIALPEASDKESWHRNFGLTVGIITVVWNILLIRVLLAFRYVLDPVYLDGYAVNGLVLSFVSLIIIPGFLLLSARLLLDFRKSPRSKRKYSLIYLSVLFVSSIIVFYLSANLWANLPAHYLPSYSYFASFISLLSLIFLYFAWFTYNSNAPWIISAIRKGNTLCQQISNFSRKFLAFSVGKTLAILVAALFGLWIVISLLKSLSPDRGIERIISQILIPLIIWLPLVLFWLSVKKEFSRKRNVVVAIVITLGCLFLTPYFIRDVGLIFAGGALFLAVSIILYLRDGFARICGLAWIGTWIILGILAIACYWQFETVLPSLPGEAGSRILAYKEDDNFQSFLLVANVGNNDNDLKLSTNKVQNIFFHTAEMKAIVHKGGMLGLGYGNSPARQSSVSQNTIQADSVYSFFIVGDYGGFGGLLLLLIYALPCLLILIERYDNLEIGSAFAFILFFSFLIEALTHAAMNLQVIPFTGRNLPLLSVGSFSSDALRWAIIFLITIVALFWRYDSNGEFENNSIRIFEKPMVDTHKSAIPPAGLNAVWLKVKHLNSFLLKKFQILIPARRIFFLVLIPLLLIGGITYRNVLITFDVNAETIRLDKTKEALDYFIENNYITVGGEEGHPECPRLSFDKEQLEEDGIRLKGVSDVGKTFIQNQIDAFNVVPCQDRLETNSIPVTDDLKIVKDIESFNNNILGRKFQFQVKPAQRFTRPNLFTVTQTILEKSDDNLEGEKINFLVEFNPAFYREKHFETAFEKNQMPEIGYKSGEMLLGQSWVKGKWISTFSEDSTILPWREGMRTYLQSEWENLGITSAKNKYQALTLDRQLNNTALNYMDRKGRDLFDKSLKDSGDVVARKMPSRVGLAIMRISNKADNGAILALAGYPRSVSGERWQTNKLGDPIPPITQVENMFSPDLRTRYGGDRNFDIGVVMGSSTKPIWATAVLETHSNVNLQQKFMVSGSGELDNSVFGIPVNGKPWETHSRVSWVDFNTFMAQSNNRYQVLLGFLGLAKSQNNEIAVQETISPSKLEQMNGNTWNKYPSFPEEIGFSEKSSDSLKNLQSTPLAKNLHRMFGVITSEERNKGFKKYLNSFWTKDENDDVYGISSKSATRIPASALPLRTNFKLNQVKNPREYVSWLLGGGENKWSNIHLAAAFASCITGKPTLPHILENDIEPKFYDDRFQYNFRPVVNILRPSLEEVVKSGTAKKFLSSTKPFLEELRKNGYQVYAKTGTLTADESGKNTARLLLAIAKTDSNGDVVDGLVFSIYGERSGVGVPAVWLSDFLRDNKSLISQLLTIN